MLCNITVINMRYIHVIKYMLYNRQLIPIPGLCDYAIK